MPTRSARRRAAHERAAIRPLPHREVKAAESAGIAVADAPTVPPVVAPNVPPEQALHDRLWADSESLLAICRRHAALVLAGPADARASRLDACRVIWTNYAAAFTAGSAMREHFADELLAVTRSLIAHQLECDGPLAEAERLPADAPQAPTLITIEELRPLLQQIIRQ